MQLTDISLKNLMRRKAKAGFIMAAPYPWLASSAPPAPRMLVCSLPNCLWPRPSWANRIRSPWLRWRPCAAPTPSTKWFARSQVCFPKPTPWPSSRWSKGAWTPCTTDTVMDLFTGLNADGMTIVMVTHSPRCATHVHRLLTVADGRLLKGTPVAERSMELFSDDKAVACGSGSLTGGENSVQVE